MTCAVQGIHTPRNSCISWVFISMQTKRPEWLSAACQPWGMQLEGAMGLAGTCIPACASVPSICTPLAGLLYPCWACYSCLHHGWMHLGQCRHAVCSSCMPPYTARPHIQTLVLIFLRHVPRHPAATLALSPPVLHVCRQSGATECGPIRLERIGLAHIRHCSPSTNSPDFPRSPVLLPVCW